MLAYIVIPYKTPWCMLGFLHGMILLSGVGAWAVLRCSWLTWFVVQVSKFVGQVSNLSAQRQVGNLPHGQLCWLPVWSFRVIAGLLLAAGIVHLGRQCYAINFRFPADQANPYVYVHTTSDTVKLADQVEYLASLADEGHDLTIHVVTPDNPWPLPWYLRAFPRVGYWSDAAAWWDETQGRPQASVLILSADLPEHINDYLAAHYRPQGIRSLRPEVFVNIYISPALWEKLAAAARPVGDVPSDR